MPALTGINLLAIFVFALLAAIGWTLGSTLITKLLTRP